MAYYKDLREFLQALERAGKLVRVKRPIVKETELMPLVRLQYRGLAEEQRMGFLFENVFDSQGRHYDGRVATGVLGASRDIAALGLQCEPGEINEKWVRAQSKPLEPKIAQSGAVQEEVLMGKDLESRGIGVLPFPVEEPGFSGLLRTTTQIVTKDPETGERNVGDYSTAYLGKTLLQFGVGPTHHAYLHWRKSLQKGKPLPAAVVIGATPNISYASMAPIPYGIDEYGVAGALAGEPVLLVRCKTVDIEVPATAEIVIEGEVTTEYLSEGVSFGDYAGYMVMGKGYYRPQMRVTAITHRKEPIFNSILVGLPPSENHVLQGLTAEVTLYKFLRYDCNLPGVLDVSFPQMGGSSNLCVIQMRKVHPAQAWSALYSTAGFMDIGKIIVVVDEDINPRDLEMVTWALAFRMQPHKDMRIGAGKAPGLDPSGHPPGASNDQRVFPDGTGAGIVMIDATRKWAYPPVALPKQEYMEKARTIWDELGLPPLRLREPWYGYSLGDWPEDSVETAQLIVNGELEKYAEKMTARRKTVSEVMGR
jgi:4-hydroxy-3-polyprenylbenzoate decarboxylase